MESGIYTIVHVVSGRAYVGSSNNVEYRWYQHRWHLNRGEHTNKRLQRAWLKYGPDAFVWTVVEPCDVAVLIEREQAHLDRLQPRVYNVGTRVEAVTYGRPVPDSVRQKLSASHKARTLSVEHVAALTAANKRRAGWKHSDAVKETCSLTNRGRVRSVAHREAIRKAQMGNTHRLGMRHSPELVAHIAKMNTGRKRTEETKAKMRSARQAYLQRQSEAA